MACPLRRIERLKSSYRPLIGIRTNVVALPPQLHEPHDAYEEQNEEESLDGRVQVEHEQEQADADRLVDDVEEVVRLLTVGGCRGGAHTSHIVQAGIGFSHVWNFLKEPALLSPCDPGLQT